MDTSGWRPSVNVQRAQPEHLRRQWLEEAALADPYYRQSWGLSPVDDATRQAVKGMVTRESPMFGAAEPGAALAFGMSRAVPKQALGIDQANIAHAAAEEWRAQNPRLEHRRPFMARNNDAMFAQMIGGLLTQQPQPTGAPVGLLSMPRRPR